MKFIIIGLGTFGASLAQQLTKAGHEVIGIDTDMSKVDAFKEIISYTICMDATDELTVAGLPLQNTDVVIVAIGRKYQGENIMVTAVMKNAKVKRLISRAISPLHEKVLQAIGVDEIVRPEQETADRWAKKLSLHHVVDSFQLNENYSIIETNVPEGYAGKTIQEVNLRSKYNLLALTLIKKVEVQGNMGESEVQTQIQGVASAHTVLEADSILVLYGANKDLNLFLTEEF